jgi:hypothetical protein
MYAKMRKYLWQKKKKKKKKKMPSSQQTNKETKKTTRHFQHKVIHKVGQTGD